MSTFLTIVVTGGTAIETASAEAQALADKLDISVQFKFNDVTCWAVPSGLDALLAARQQAAQALKPRGPYERKFVSSSPEARA